VRHPASWAFLGWRYDEGTWARGEGREAWEGLVGAARGRDGEECRRQGPGV